jgi:hypothetical protein
MIRYTASARVVLLALVAVACSSPSNEPQSAPSPTESSLPAEADCASLATAAEVNAFIDDAPGLRANLDLAGPETTKQTAPSGAFRGVELTTCNYSSNAATVGFSFGQGPDAATVRTEFEQTRPRGAVDVAGVGDAAYFSREDATLLVIRGTTFVRVSFAGGGGEYGSVITLRDPQALHVPLALHVLAGIEA